MYPTTKCITLLVLLITVSGTYIFAQQKTPDAAAIEDIRTAYKEINTKTLTREHFAYETEGCVDEGIVEYFLDNQQILKIVESGSIGDGSWKTEYYFRNGDLIFCFETLIGGPAIGKVEKTERRVYLNGGKVIRYMEDQKIIPADSRTPEITEAGLKFLKAHTTKNFAAVLCN